MMIMKSKEFIMFKRKILSITSDIFEFELDRNFLLQNYINKTKDKDWMESRVFLLV